MHAHTQTHAHKHMHACTHTYTHTSTHTYTHTHTQTHTHTRTHTQASACICGRLRPIHSDWAQGLEGAEMVSFERVCGVSFTQHVAMHTKTTQHSFPDWETLTQETCTEDRFGHNGSDDTGEPNTSPQINHHSPFQQSTVVQHEVTQQQCPQPHLSKCQKQHFKQKGIISLHIYTHSILFVIVVKLFLIQWISDLFLALSRSGQQI